MPRPYHIPPEIARLRGSAAGYARAVRDGKRRPDDPEILAARRDLAYEGLAEHIRRVVDAAPPATPEQLDKLNAILAGAA